MIIKKIDMATMAANDPTTQPGRPKRSANGQNGTVAVTKRQRKIKEDRVNHGLELSLFSPESVLLIV